MKSEKTPYKYYDTNSELLSTLNLKKKKDYGKSQNIALVFCGIGLLAITVMLIGYNYVISRVKYSPVKAVMAVSSVPSKVRTKIINVPDKDPPAPSLEAASMYMSIPKLMINTPLEETSSSVGEDVATPQNPVNIAWYKNGKKPGEVGNSILSGFMNGGSTSGILTGLDRLKNDDEIKVIFKDKNVMTYKIVDIKKYKQGEDIPSEQIKKEDGKYLTLFAVSGSGVTAINAGRDRMMILAKAD